MKSPRSRRLSGFTLPTAPLAGQVTADAELLSRARAKASARDDVALAIYTRELFGTPHDAANRAAVASVASDDLDLVGIALRGPRNVVDRIVKGARFHD